MIEVRKKIVSITKKGQATLPIKMRRKHGLKRKVLVIDTKDGLLMFQKRKWVRSKGFSRRVQRN